VTLSCCNLNWNLSNKWRYLVPQIAFSTFEILESLPHIFIVLFISECGCSTFLHSSHVLSLVWLHHFNLELGSLQLLFILRSTFCKHILLKVNQTYPKTKATTQNSFNPKHSLKFFYSYKLDTIIHEKHWCENGCNTLDIKRTLNITIHVKEK
jgi:hypothetical protein